MSWGVGLRSYSPTVAGEVDALRHQAVDGWRLHLAAGLLAVEADVAVAQIVDLCADRLA